MNLRTFFQRVRELKRDLGPGPVVIVSQDTSDGGVEGATVEASTEVAARLIAEGKARVASEEEARKYRADQQEAYLRALEAQEAQRAYYLPVTRESLKQMSGRTKPTVSTKE